MDPYGGNGQDRRVSVAMCTFNGAHYLEEQLESIALQSRLPCELVVCDDRSTDETLAILKRFQAEAPFAVKVIQNGQRLGSTRNFDQAIGLARGEFIALCDQDDRWTPTKLERLSEALKEDPFLGGVFSDANLIDGDGRQVGVRLFAKHKFTETKQRNFVSCPTATLLKHDVVTGATLMFQGIHSAVLLSDSCIMGTRWMACVDDCAARAPWSDCRTADRVPGSCRTTTWGYRRAGDDRESAG